MLTLSDAGSNGQFGGWHNEMSRNVGLVRALNGNMCMLNWRKVKTTIIQWNHLILESKK